MIIKKFKAWQAHIKYTSYQLLTSQLMGHPFARFQSHLSILYGYLTPKPYMGNTPPPSNGDKARQERGASSLHPSLVPDEHKAKGLRKPTRWGGG